jgi:protease-4
LILFLILIVWAVSKPRRLPSKGVLVIDAEGQIDEQPSPSFLGALTGDSTPVLHDYLDAIDSARSDSRITGLVVRIAPLATGWGKLEEIRSHLIAFQSSGKPSICYLGYDGTGNEEYYLATACQQIWLVPSSEVSIRGMIAEAMFFRGALDKFKVVPQFYHIAEYKTAYNMFTEKGFTAPDREQVGSVLHSIYDQYISDSAQARHLDRAKFESLVNQGPLLTSEALQNKIVDRLAYWDQVQDYFKGRNRRWNPISLDRYRASMKPDGRVGGQEIAVVHATGLIVSGESQTNVSGGFVMGGDSVASDLRDARTDPSIKAIILRVDSGGGSVVASEVIRREVELAEQAKPVVVSMSDVAASGGYWIATPASKIVADPDTITGSIGVLTGKLNLSGLYNLLGVSTDFVATSDNATLYSDQQNFTPEQQANIQKSLDETYAEFTSGVAAGRKMSLEAVQKIAKGREWTGVQAKQLGLVDELGGFDRAVEVAKDLAKIPESASVRIVRFPEERNFFREFFQRDDDQLDGDISGLRSDNINGQRPGNLKDQLANQISDSRSGNISDFGSDNINVSRSIEETLRRLALSLGPVQARVPYELHIR